VLERVEKIAIFFLNFSQINKPSVSFRLLGASQSLRRLEAGIRSLKQMADGGITSQSARGDAWYGTVAAVVSGA
jgi:hypothetical protein